MQRAIVVAVVVLTGCTTDNADYLPPAIRAFYNFDAGALQLPSEARDLAVPSDLALPDLAAPDLAVEVDAASAPDLVQLGDLAVAPDLVPASDLDFDRACFALHCQGRPDLGACGPQQGFDCCATLQPFNVPCRAPGESCASDKDCDPGMLGAGVGSCVGGVCCGGWGRGCTKDADCCSGRCRPVPGAPMLCR